MTFQMEQGDYVLDERGRVVTLTGGEAVLQRALFRLTARRGQFPLLPNLGSRLYQLGRERPSAREALATQYVIEALAPEEDLRVVQARLLPHAGGVSTLRLELQWKGRPLTLSLPLPSFP